ncbi:MAG: ribonuclease III [bacterium]|nr:ribonuclease III [bacterium]
MISRLYESYRFNILEENLQVSFIQKDLLVQGFVHRSYLNENPAIPVSHNERLEFLGDAVLELVVTEYLYKHYPDKTEGELTSWRAALVNTKMLSSLARDLGFNDYLLLSKGEQKEEGRAREFILADTFEAFTGALYLDQGLQVCKDMMVRTLLPCLSDIIDQKLFQDAKSRLQELAQERLSVTPTYKVIQETGPDHAKRFQVGAYLNGDMIAEGEGFSKQEAEEEAAKRALEVKEWK